MLVGDGFVQLFGFDLARGVGDVDGAVDEGGDAGAGAAAGDGDADFGVGGLVALGPGQGQVDDGVGAFILNGNSREAGLPGVVWGGAGDEEE